MPGTRAEALLTMTYFIRRFTLNRAWLGLTDEELFWEPIAGAWGIRRRDECKTANPFSSTDPDWVADYDHALARAADWRTTIEPLTTIGWLFWHVGSMPGRLTDLDFLGGSKAAQTGWTSPYATRHPIFTTAAEAVETMRSGWSRLIAALRSATDEDLERPFEAPNWPAPATGTQYIASVLNEVSHHASQICTLRDLYVVSRGSALLTS